MNSRTLLLAGCLLFLGCDQKAENNEVKEIQTQSEVSTPIKDTKVEEYVSIDSEKGDITLTLDPGNTFDLTILLWDEANNKHSGSETLKGSWRLQNSDLVLNTSDSNTIIYAPTTSKMTLGKSAMAIPAYRVKTSKRPFFGTGHDLLEKKQTDKFILDQSQSSPK